MSNNSLAIFVSFLRANGHLVTRQRKEVAEILFRNHSHMSAERIQELVKREKIKASSATVYRTLGLLVKSGLVVQHRFGKRFKIFEAVKQGEHHGHLVCEKCGKVEDFKNEAVEELIKQTATEHGFQIKDYELEFRGTCKKCKGTENS